MSETLSQSENSFDATERRLHPRHPVKSLAYLDIGPDNGGIVVNISAGGLAIHAVSGLPPESVISLRIQLPRSTKRLEAQGKVAWTSDSRKDAGVEFVDLAEEARLGITEWLSTDIAPQPMHTEEVFPSEPTQPPAGRRTDKWTNLVAELASQKPPENQTAAETFFRRPHAETPQTSDEALRVSSPPVAPAPRAENRELLDEARENVSAPAALTNELADLRADILSNGDAASAAPDGSRGSTPDGETYPRQRNAGLSLPSDTMLNTTSQGFAVYSGSKEKTKAPKASRTFRGSRASGAPADDFLTKARALFSVKRAVSPDSDSSDPPPNTESGIEPVAIADPVDHVARSQMLSDSRSQNGAASPLMELPFPDISDASEPILAEHAADSRHTDSIARNISPDARLRAAGTRQTGRQRAGSSLTLGTSLAIFGLCLVLAIVCLGLGVLVGRKSAKPLTATSSPDSASSLESSLSTRTGPNKTSADSVGASPDSHLKTRSGGRPQSSTNVELSRDSSEASRTPSGDQRDPDPSSSAGLAGDSVVPRRENAVKPVTSQRTSSPSENLPAPVSAPTASISTPASSGNVPQRPEATPPAQSPPDRLVPAHAIYRVEPFYPRVALQQGVEGTVKIRATVDRDGKVKNLKVISGPALLTASALDAAQYWRYIPSLRNGEPIETEEEISIEFHLTH